LGGPRRCCLAHSMWPKCSNNKVATPALSHAQTAVIVGANRGDIPNDPSFSYLANSPHIRKVFVEPIPHLFKLLQRNVAKLPNASAVNAAITTAGGKTLEMFCLIDPHKGTVHSTVPFFADQICSLHKDRLFNSGDVMLFSSAEKVHKSVRSISVPTLSLRQLLNEELGAAPLDYLQVDTEGEDYNIVLQALELVPPPKSLMFEHMLLSSTHRTELRWRLALHYDFCCQAFDDVLCDHHQHHWKHLRRRKGSGNTRQSPSEQSEWMTRAIMRLSRAGVGDG